MPQKLDWGDVSSSIETIKDGMGFSPKYESAHFLGDIPHIVIFSNYLPFDFNKLSFDRWKIYRIGSTTKKLIYMNTIQVNEFISNYNLNFFNLF